MQSFVTHLDIDQMLKAGQFRNARTLEPDKSKRWTPDKSKPIAFDCPSCGAKYIIVTTDIVNGVQRSKFGCVKCGSFRRGAGFT
jgi:predicted RNA-binding Zn-ribbon protein involved in translation (DUF1610 family)